MVETNAAVGSPSQGQCWPVRKQQHGHAVPASLVPAAVHRRAAAWRAAAQAGLEEPLIAVAAASSDAEEMSPLYMHLLKAQLLEKA
jgi:hypothetical protein